MNARPLAPYYALRLPNMATIVCLGLLFEIGICHIVYELIHCVPIAIFTTMQILYESLYNSIKFQFPLENLSGSPESEGCVKLFSINLGCEERRTFQVPWGAFCDEGVS